MNKRIKATKLRLQGKSYGEIMKTLNISSKGTLSYWFRDLELSTTAKRRLQRTIGLSYQRGLFAFNEKRTKTILAENKSIFLQASKEIPKLSQKELLVVGAALYWAEGVNREAARGYRLPSFTNSDPKMVKIFMRYLRDILQVSDDRVKPGVIIYPNLDREKAKGFWADITNLPESTFWSSVAVSKTSKLRKPSNYLPYGTVHLRVNSRKLFYKIQGHIDGIAKKLSSLDIIQKKM